MIKNRKIWKMMKNPKNDEKSEKSEKWRKIWKMIKNLKNYEKSEKLWKIRRMMKNPKNDEKSEKWRKIIKIWKFQIWIGTFYYNLSRKTPPSAKSENPKIRKFEKSVDFFRNVFRIFQFFSKTFFGFFQKYVRKFE